MNIVFGLWADGGAAPDHGGEGAGAWGRRWSVLMAFSKFLSCHTACLCHQAPGCCVLPPGRPRLRLPAIPPFLVQVP